MSSVVSLSLSLPNFYARGINNLLAAIVGFLWAVTHFIQRMGESS